MNRNYSAESYYELIEYARKVMPDVVITSDVIVGFPGETEEDFQCTLDLVDKVQFDNLYTFNYSKRTGTKAAVMENQVEESVKKERFNRLLELQHAVCLKKNKEMEGKDVTVYVESVCLHNILKTKDTRTFMEKHGCHCCGISLFFLLHWHVALDAVGKHNHCLGADNAGNLLYTAIEQLHEMLVVVGVHLCKD
jgi:tRNA A37 methylthiotransferase MiaB